MTAGPSPIRVDRETRDRIAHAAEILGMTKKDLVADAVREYVAARESVFEEGVRRIEELLTPRQIVVPPGTAEQMADLTNDPPAPSDKLRELADT